LRLAERPEQESAGDLYEGEDASERPGLLHGVWIWTKRLVVVAVLVGGGILAALTWQTWFPKAGELGEQALTGIDRQVRSKEIESARQQLLEEASEQLPQLAPETIALLLSRRPDDVPDLPALFQAATDAVARGRVSLTPLEALELDALQDELLGELHPTERQHVRDYERAREARTAFPSEERELLVLLARGAQAMPPKRLERLQGLLGRVIAAGLPSPPPASTSPLAP
jgi:hypothetical protein